MNWQETIVHFFLHFTTCLVHPSQAIWAVIIEVGDEVRHMQDPDRHPEGFDLGDFAVRCSGAAAGIAIRILIDRFGMGN